jgi:hypothetical protein
MPFVDAGAEPRCPLVPTSRPRSVAASGSSADLPRQATGRRASPAKMLVRIDARMLVRIELPADAWPRSAGVAPWPAAIAVRRTPAIRHRPVPQRRVRAALSTACRANSRCAQPVTGRRVDELAPRPRLLTTARMHRAGLLPLRAPDLWGRGRLVCEPFTNRLLALAQSVTRAGARYALQGAADSLAHRTPGRVDQGDLPQLVDLVLLPTGSGTQPGRLHPGSRTRTSLPIVRPSPTGRPGGG